MARVGHLVGASFLLAIGIVAIIIGSIMPTLVNKAIHDAIIKANVISQENMKEDDYDKWKNSDVTLSYYVWNVTNVDRVLSGQDSKLIFKEVGPYSYTKYQKKYNIAYNDDKTEVTYYEWDYFVQQNVGERNGATDKVITINPVYFLAVARTAVMGDDASEARFLAGLGTQAFPTVNSTFYNPSGPFVSALSVAFIPAFLSYVSALIKNQTIFEAQFQNAYFPNCTNCPSPNYFCSSSNKCQLNPQTWGGVSVTHFELDSAANSADVSQLLGNASHRYYLLSSTGVKNWTQILMLYQTNPAAAVANLTQTGIINPLPFLSWFTRMYQDSNKNHLTFSSFLVKSFGYRLNINLTGSIDSWSDLGLVQWGTLLISRTLLNTSSLVGIGPLIGLQDTPELPLVLYKFDSRIAYVTNVDTARSMFLQPSPDALLPLFILKSISQDQQDYLQLLGVYFVWDKFLGPITPKGSTYFNSGLFSEHTVNEVLFGYNQSGDVILLRGNTTYPGPFGPNISSLEQDFAVNSYSGEGYYTKKTGQDDYNIASQYVVYSGYSNITYINDVTSKRHGSACETPSGKPRFSYSGDCRLWLSTEYVIGSRDGLQAKMFTEGDTPEDVMIWVSEAKRVVRMKYREDIEYKGIKAKKYMLDENAFLNQTANPLNAKYLMNLDSYIVPMLRYGGYDGFISKPHFLDLANTSVNIQGLNPDSDKHNTYLYIEPLSGRTISGRKRLQLGFFLSTNRFSLMSPYAKIFKSFSNSPLYIPFVWGEEGKDISDDDASSFVSKIYDNRKLGNNVQYSLVPIGVVLVIFAGVWFKFGCQGPTSTA